ncbi:glycosyl transferase [Thermacetogenium phaeum DSM 12270]|uniref:Glycosyl transferase n=1 Tax=Thermacetogenium phaeum (strain ATCC BAA-254 / DSM 26808 / PB) TaxID=1089553 RepID=K4LEW0_THEPS|nr:glycosyltransferase [Thermacetogenium phaeum]AFV10520.1 glycosyl transferase [Thermacetogenium phaeum DSM 12270]
MQEKIALFVPSLRGGGAERVMVNLARGFAERGISVELVLAKVEGPYLSKVPKDVRIVDLKACRVLYALPGLVRYLKREKPLAMLSTLNHANIIALWAKRLARVSTRIVVREASTIRLSSANAPTVKGRFMPLLMRLFYSWADAVVAISKGVAEDLIQITKLPKEKVKVIYNPVITNEIFEKAEEPVEHPWFAQGEPPVILGVGRLTEQKDFATLIRAFHLVRKECNAKLVILGEGEKRAELEKLVEGLGLKEDVDMPGFVKNPFKYMKRATVFVFSSKWEGFGNVLVEAMAVGTPVVSTDCPSGPAEILEGGEYGYLVPLGDINAMARAILSIIKEKKIDTGFQQHALKFTVDKIVECYLEVLYVQNKQKK